MALGPERVAQGLEARYGISVEGVFPLDEETWRVACSDGRDWVARVFPAARAAAAVAGDGAILALLERLDYPAERCADEDPVTAIDGHRVLVTGYVAPVPTRSRADVIRGLGGLQALGELLARLALAPAGAPADRPGGAWHHLADGGPRQEIDAAAAMLDGGADLVGSHERGAHRSLADALRGFDDGAGLPTALVHPDFVMRNVVASRERGLVLVDWAGVGVAPRAWALAWLLYSEGAKDLRRVKLVAAGYARQILPEPAELERLAAIMAVRPAILAIWSFCVGRISLADAHERVAAARASAVPIAAAAAAAFSFFSDQSRRTTAMMPTATISARSGPGGSRRP